MIDVTFTINGVDYSEKLSTYSVIYEPEYPTVIRTIDGTEHFGALKWRPTVTFTLRPLTETETNALFSGIARVNTVVFTDPQENVTKTAYMRFTSEMRSAFGVSSINGNRYYKGGEMILRGISVV